MTSNAFDLRQLPGMREHELGRLGPCAVCGQQLLFDQHKHATFYVVTLQRAMFDVNTLKSRVGSMKMSGGISSFARAMAPNDDLAKVFDGPMRVVVHESCADKIDHLLLLVGAPIGSEEGGAT